MSFLKWLESVRTPFFDVFFSLVTRLGEETVFILVGLIFFWCVNKRHGYYLLSVGFLGTVINQFLKLSFRIPRPEKLSPGFTIVESARKAATGYSFPSGHTQTAVGVFGGIARIAKRWRVIVPCAVLSLLVLFSRMYLGVHTPLDVFVSLGVALLLVFGLYPLLQKATSSQKGMRIFLASLLGIGVLYLLFVLLFPFPEDIDVLNYESGVKNAYKILGCVLGLFLAYEVDERWLHFRTEGVLWVQILKLLIGLIPLLAIKEGLRAPLDLLFCDHVIADGIRYFLLTGFAGAVWPMTFPWFCRLPQKLAERKKRAK
ncbi:MAG: phosphatase PAP2 family protein [Clostridia bacterium]|nr:phosphatase PAP2 family protein [Clostridia bacterium]